MNRWLVSVGLALILCTVSLQAQEGPQRGKIKKIDLEREILSLAADGKDEEFQLAKDTQVQVVWIKQADARPTQGFPAYAQKLQKELTRIVQLLPGRFPNVRLVYLSGRTYGGFAKTPLNPEPYAYESGFSVKWLIEQQLRGNPALKYDPEKGPARAPWLSWGPYLWDNGVIRRADGYYPEESDFAGDGTHHAHPGIEKMGVLLLRFFQTDSTARPWFVRP